MRRKEKRCHTDCHNLKVCEAKGFILCKPVKKGPSYILAKLNRHDYGDCGIWEGEIKDVRIRFRNIFRRAEDCKFFDDENTPEITKTKAQKAAPRETM
jgi:uncharacterized protein (UPF0179 family)